MSSKQVKCERAVDYCHAGAVYDVEQSKRFVYFHNVATGGRTAMPVWQFKAAMASGAMVPA